MSDPLGLDRWLSDPAVRTRHRRTTTAAPDVVWDAARRLRLGDTRTLGRLVRWRLPDTPADSTFAALLARRPFTVLDEGPRHSISGLCGRIWTFRYDYADLDGAQDFARWEESGTVRVLFANWVEVDEDGRATLCDEARVKPVDRAAGLRLRLLWTTIGRFEGLIGSEAVGRAVRLAEATR